MVQFGAIILCRTFQNYFGQFVWIEKKSHYKSRVSLHEAPTKNTAETRRWKTLKHQKAPALRIERVENVETGEKRKPTTKNPSNNG